DIVFLQRARAGETPERSWVDVGEIVDALGGPDMPLNTYFIDRPHMMLGSMQRAGTQYAEGTPALIAPEGQDLVAELAAAIQQLPEGIYIG
ncbi:hypothetical protein SB783_43870, partial [Paraburkholderia sp. SIMBA_009]